MRPSGQKSEDENVEVVVNGDVDDGGAGHVEAERQPVGWTKKFCTNALAKAYLSP